MNDFHNHRGFSISRRSLLGYSAAAGLAVGLRGPLSAFAQDNPLGVTADEWTPDYISSIAGTLEVDTAAECAKVVPLDYSGSLTYWYVGPNEASPELDHELYKQFWAAFAETYPNIKIEAQSLGYNDMLNKIRTAALGNAAPMVARMPILWGVEFAAKGQLHELGPEDVGYPTNEFWPGAMKSVTWQGKTYGVPTNNETMALIWNASIFDQAGLDPESPPATWDDLVNYSKQIKDSTGKNGYGLVARVNAGNTPFRFMPQAWAEGGGALDEAEATPTYQQVYINNEGTQHALQQSYDMYVRDKSVPVSALTNTNNENMDPFTSDNLAMIISHPSTYAAIIDRANKAVGQDKATAEAVVENMRYGLIPKGAARRAVVFGGSNAHMFHPDVVDGGSVDVDAVRAFLAFSTGPEWSTKLHWTASNPGNLRGFRTSWMKERLEQIKFLEVSTAMLTAGVPFPVVPESPEIMNIIVPEMMQNALTDKMTVQESCDDAARKVEQLMSGL
ncbi:MAG: extracellular solute-binding protein [Pseudomonadota bacterium]